MSGWADGRGEEGSSLLVALIFVLVFSLFVAAVISFTEVGILATRSFASRTREAYAADGALKVAVQRYADGGPCDDYAAPAGPDGTPVNGNAMVVHCGAGTRASAPVNALLSLGDAPLEDGIASTADLRVLGSIVSNSTVSAGGTLVVHGEVSAQGSCTPLPNIRTAPPVPLHCLNANPPADPGLGRDPDYTSAVGAVPARRTVPPCPAAAPRIVALQPGYYDDDQLPRLNDLTAAGRCTGAVVWFRPGVYYLDFTFLRGAGAPGSGRWTVSEPSVHVVGGTPDGWEADGDPLPTAVPGACQEDGPGVQIVMGGQSTRLEVTAGKVEFCAEPSGAEQQIAIFGMRASLARHLMSPTTVSGGTGFAGTANAMTIGEQPPPPPAGPPPGPLTAVAVLTQEAPSASVTLAGFRPAIPPGSVIDSAGLRVAHQDDPGVGTVSVSASGEVAGPSCPSPRVLPLRTALTEEPAIDLKACGLTTPAALNNLAVTYTATTASATPVSDNLDGVAVEVVYRPPSTRKPTVVTASSNFATADRAFEIGELDAGGGRLTATATLGGAVTSASITLAGLADPPVPAGSTIDAAVLRVAHTDAGDIAAGSPTVTAGPCNAQPLSVFPTGGEDRVDLKACGPVTDATLAGLTATYQVGLAAGGTATDELDGMWLELVYTPPLVTTAAATATPGAVFTGVNNATTLDGVTADASLTGSARSASLTVSDFAIPPAPAGAGLDAAVVRVRHRDDGSAGPVTLTATWTGGVGGSCSATFPAHPGSLVDDRLDLRACGFGDRSLAGLTVTYTSVLRAAGGTATDHVDGIVLDLAHAPAATREPTVSSAVTGFVDPDNARAIGGAPVLTADAAPGATAASFTLGGFDEPVRIPAGSAVDSAVLRVSHQDDGPIGPVGLMATFPGSPPSGCGVASLPLHAGAQGVDLVDLGSCGLREASQIAGLVATYTAAATADTTRPATSVPASTFANGADAMVVDGASAQAVLDTTATSPASASITLAGYDVTAPPGATLDSAVLKVVHRDDAPIGPVTVEASWTGGAGGTCLKSIPSRPTTLGQDLVSLKACGLADLADLTGLTVTYTATLGTAGATASDFLDGISLQFATSRVDGVALDVVFRPPALRPLSGCVTSRPYPATGCALVKVAPSGASAAERMATRFVSKGTVFAPSAALDIAMEGLDDQVLTRGLIARAIRLGLVAAPGFNRPTSGVPPEAVVFTAYPASKVRNDVRAVNAASTGFGTVANALAIGETPDPLTADAAIDTAAPPLARTIVLDGFAEPSLPAGTAIDQASLRIAHHDEPGIASAAVTFDFAGRDANCDEPVELPLHAGGLAEDQVDLASCGFDSPSQLAGLTVSYTATADPAATGTVTDRLDGIVLVVRFGPVLRAGVTFDRGRATVREWSVLR